MKNKNKVTIFLVGIVVMLLIVVGVTYAAFTFNRVSKTSKLIAGDIYMHYKETNELVLSDTMPLDINTYKVNEIMKTQTIDYKNELTACTLIHNYGNFFDPGSSAESFCKGTGTYNEGL